MDSPLDINKQLSHIENIESVAFERLFINYLELDLRGEKKLIEIDSTDQESLIQKFNFGLPIPGMIYTFWHVNPKDMAILMGDNSNRKFHDVAPLLFCTYSNPLKKVLGGINMNMLPPKERLKFLIAYYKLYKSFFKDLEQDTQNNIVAINKKYIKFVLTGQGQKIIRGFNLQQNARFDYGYRKYLMPNIRKFRMIEYEEWSYLPFFNAKQAFKKINLNEIHRKYWQNKKKT